MTSRSVRWIIVLAFLGATTPMYAQDSLRVLTDTTRVQVLRLSDRSTVVGRVIEIRGDTALVRTASGQLTVARSAVRSVRERAATSMRAGEYWPEDPNASRLFFAPTGRMLARGEGYFCDVLIVFVCLTGGLTDRITMGGGMSIIPGLGADNVFYLTPKVGVYAGDKVQVAVGAFTGWSGAVTSDASSFGILYSVSTFGSEDSNLTLGAGYVYYSDKLANSPLVLAGLKLRMFRRTAFISENYILPDGEGGVVTYGLRFFDDRIAGDVGLARLVGAGECCQGIGIPFVGLAVKFH